MSARQEKLLKSVTTGFAFFALVVLVTEGILAMTALRLEQGWDRTFLFISGVAMLAALTIIVAALLYFRPWVLTGDPPPAPVINLLSPPPMTTTPILVTYFLRGIREYYLHVLADFGNAAPKHVRFNVMLMVPSESNKSKAKTLRIIHVDYPNLYADGEFKQEFPSGSFNCGEAWRLGQMRHWAADLHDTVFVESAERPSDRAKTRKSVISCPIECAGERIGVLNLDSDEDSKATYVQLPAVQNVVAEGARQIVPLLFPEKANGTGR